MTQSLEFTGRSEEEAISKALQQLGLERDDISIEVVSRAKAGFLGFGASPAKVLITYEDKEAKPVATEVKPVETVVPKQETAKKEPVPQETKPPVVTAKPEAPKSVASEVKPKPEQKKVEQNKPKPKQDRGPKPEKKEKKSGPYAPFTPEEQEIVMAEIHQYLTGLLVHLHVEAKPEISYDGDNFLVKIQGEQLGALIGRRGETLDAIQQLTSYSVNKITTKKVRIFLDAENYREKREETLRKLAEKVAGEAVKHKRNVTLESMNAYERHIIHAALETYQNVSTYSTGSDPNRRTVVAYNPKKSHKNQ